jgi:hypothetical protein
MLSDHFPTLGQPKNSFEVKEIRTARPSLRIFGGDAMLNQTLDISFFRGYYIILADCYATLRDFIKNLSKTIRLKKIKFFF